MLSQYGLCGLSRAWLRRIMVGSVSAVILATLPGATAWSATSQTVEVVAVIKPELSLTIEPETGPRIDLGTTYSSPVEPRLSRPVRVTVHIFSNLAKPYQVTQHLVQPLTNEEGTSLPPDTLLTHFDAPAPHQASEAVVMAQQPRVLFASDADGLSATQSVSYQLRVPPRQPAGTYRGTLLMTVTAQ